ncbi:hypothetical protein KSS87_023466 [Heliosperma pusillum]|nr:hypothetical protein KSS87_023466 [Heliosperma pusillum]
MAMVTNPTPLRFSPSTSAASYANLDALNRVVSDLCTRGQPKDGTIPVLRRHIEEAAHDLNGEAFSRFMDLLYDKISNLLESGDVAENLGALRVINELIDVPLGESASRVSRFSAYIRTVFEVKREREILVLASRVLGHLARSGGAMTADEVEHQIRNALNWLRGERIEYRRLAAVLILKEMAENASTVFNVHVPDFVDAIWIALRDPSLDVRERAVEALRACLQVIEQRETRWRVQWYYRMFEATQEGLGKNAPVHSIHGSLLAVGELLRNTGEFMMSRYREVADIVLRYLEHRDRLVRLSITSLLPRIAHFLRDRFVTNYLTICMDHILAVLKIPAERASGFTALGEMAGALDGELVHYLPTIMTHLRDAIAPRRGRPSGEALSCVGSIAKAMGLDMEPHVRGLLDAMFSAGLSSQLVGALDQISVSIPSLLSTIQERLLESISLALSKSHHTQARPASTGRANVVNAPMMVSDVAGPAVVQLALQTLAQFNFKGHDLLEFARQSVISYLEDEDAVTRKDAALCCCRLVANSFSGTSSQLSSARSNRTGGRRRRLIEEIVGKLLIAAVADADVSVRLSIFQCLHEDRGFDEFLAQADSLSAIFAALNDEDLQVREFAISVAGRLAEKNPAYVLPALRRFLIQLLTYLEQSVDSKCREESAKSLGCLIRSCERLIHPYIAPIHKALVAKLREGSASSANSGIVASVLVTVGDLARVGGFAMRQYIPELMPLIVDALVDGAAVIKREVVVTTLGQVVQSTGYVITPYNDYPQLLGLLLKLLNGDLAWSTRREVLKVLGIMGALDPYVHKRNQPSLPGSHGEVNHTTNEAGQHIRSMEDLPMDLWPSFTTSSEDYFSTVAINSLMRVLRDPSLSSYHQNVVGSLMFIFKSMGLGCVPYLQKVLPDLFQIVRTCDDILKEFITWKLGTLVSIVRQHIRKYLSELLALISELWTSFSLPPVNRSVRGLPVLHLVEQLCVALNDEFRTYLPVILPCCIQVLSDAERCNDFTFVPDILHTLEVFGGTLDEHMHLLLPALIRLFKVDASVGIRQAAIRTLTRLIPRVQVTGHISSLVHHLKLVLDGRSDDLRKDSVDALCCLAHALGEDFTIFIPSVHKLLLKHRLRHREFEEIEGRFRRREPLISGSTAAQRLSRSLPVEVIADPLKDVEYDPYSETSDSHREARSHQVNDGRLRTAGEASQRSTREDWAEWMRHFSIELLRESPSPALRTCARHAQLQAEFMEHDERPLPIDIRLLGALAEKCRAFAKALHYKEMEFEGAHSRNMDADPVAVVEALIHINNQLHQHEAAVGILTYAQQHLDAQLRESWYEKLQRWDDALKAYTAKSAQATTPHALQEATLGRMRCLAALARWEELNTLCREYWTPAEQTARMEIAPMAANAAWNMGEWDQMSEYVKCLDDGDETKFRVLGNTSATGDGSSNGTFFRAVLLVRRGKVEFPLFRLGFCGWFSNLFNTYSIAISFQYDEARECVERARKCLATELAALVLESYERAYSNMVRVQQLSELEEVIDYCTLPVGNQVAEGRRTLIRNMWTQRIHGVKQDIETWLKFASLCRKSGRINQAKSTLVKLLQYDPETSPRNVHYRGSPQVMLAYLKYLWSLGEDYKRRDAFIRLQELAIELSSSSNISVTPQTVGNISSPTIPLTARVYLKLGTWQRELTPVLDDEAVRDILGALENATHCAPNWAKAWHSWALFNTAVMSHYTLRGTASIAGQFVGAAVTGYFHSIACGAHSKGVDDSLQDILRLLTLWFNHGATADVQQALQKGFELVSIDTWLVVLPQIIARIHSNNPVVRELIQSLLVRIGQSHPQALMYPLLVACKSISEMRKAAAEKVVDQVRQHSSALVDEAQLVSKELIRVAILWHEMWHEALEEASRLYFGEHNIDGMLNVLEPLHVMLEEGFGRPDTTINEVTFIQTYRQDLLQAFECCMRYKRTGNEAELTQAWDLYYHVFKRIDRQLNSLTTLDLQSVSPELLSCRDLELAVPGTYRADAPVVTIVSFAPQLTVMTSKQRPRKLTIHGSDGEDYAFLLKGHEDLRQDERVMQLFGLVNTLLENSRKTAEKDLSIQRYAVIPLSPNSGLIGWVPNCDTLHHLIREYRDARRITLNQEHRLMLSFAPDYDHLPLISKVEVFEYALQNTEGNDLSRVLWLKSRTSEVWLYRRTNYTRSLAVMSMAVFYDMSLCHVKIDSCMTSPSVMDEMMKQIIRVMPWCSFCHLSKSLKCSLVSVQDLISRNGLCTEFATSMLIFGLNVRQVGYLLGLGDRHPSNLMLHRYSGKILHIDFGDCFEASMNREKFPEKVPFRLTRMLVKAMEVSGIEGTFRTTCENVMQVLRTNKDSVMAMMEAFVHDPLINWRLFNFNEVPQMAHAPAVVNSEESSTSTNLAQPQRGARERELLQAVHQLGDANEVLNERAVMVMARMSNKLTGRDFSTASTVTSASQLTLDSSNPVSGDAREVEHGLSVKLQVQKLIDQATSYENLCQNYVGYVFPHFHENLYSYQYRFL